MHFPPLPTAPELLESSGWQAGHNRTVHIALQRVIRVLDLCARKWRDEERRPLLNVVPMISLLDEKTNSRKPYPLSWEEPSILFTELPAHLQTMAMFKVNTGYRSKRSAGFSGTGRLRASLA